MSRNAAEATIAFPCFGGEVIVSVAGGRGAERALDEARRLLEGWHVRFTRFDPASELSRLNANPEARVKVSNVLCRFAAAAIDAAAQTGGLVDPTLVGEIEDAGYRSDLSSPMPLELSLAMTPRRRPARPSREARWRRVKVDRASRAIIRQPGVKLDSGGIAKGLFADILAERLDRYVAFAVDCSGDIRIGGRARLPRTVRVDDPFDRGVLHELDVVSGAVATSGIGRRSWLDRDGRPAHHLLDPSTGRPAFTGVVQATALAPTAVEAEALAKAALLSGPDGGARWLRHGGVLVLDDGSHKVIERDASQDQRTHAGRRGGARRVRVAAGRGAEDG
jgi:thiamine biosynthesis lipoprotein